MAMTPAERKRRQRERYKAMDLRIYTMELSATERAAIEEGARLREFEDQTEYILSLVYKDRDMSRKENVCSFPDCRCPFDIGPDGKCAAGKPREANLD